MQEEDDGGPLGECLKTLDYLKGRMQFGPADVKEIVKEINKTGCVFVYSCVEHVTFPVSR